MLGIVSLFIFVYILNVLYPLVSEDWMYSFVFGCTAEDPSCRISGIKDIIISQYNHYMLWTGRSIVHIIDQYLLFIDERYHNIINSLAYVVFTYVIYKIANYKNNINGGFFLLLILLMWIFLPDFPTNVLWLTYSAVYLWGTLLVLIFIYPYYKYYRQEDVCVSNSFLKSFLLFGGGIIAGWTYENISVTLVCFLILFFFLLKKEKRAIPQWMIWGGIGALIGCLILMLAPGNFNRLEISTEAFIPDINFRLSRILINFLKCMLLPTIIYVLLLLHFKRYGRGYNKKYLISISILFVIGAYINFIIMTVSPKFPSRTLFGSVAFLIIGISILLANNEFQKIWYKNLYYVIIAFMLIFGIYDYIYKYNYTSYLNDLWHRREVFLKEQKDKGVVDIVFTERIERKRGFISYDLSESPYDWPNTDYAKYYGVRSVRIE